MEKIPVDDLPLAAFLRTKGFILLEIRPNALRPGLLTFIFQGSAEIERETLRFQNRETRVEPKSYLLTLRQLKGGLLR
jgi:hypothetical protein